MPQPAGGVGRRMPTTWHCGTVRRRSLGRAFAVELEAHVVGESPLKVLLRTMSGTVHWAMPEQKGVKPCPGSNAWSNPARLHPCSPPAAHVHHRSLYNIRSAATASSAAALCYRVGTLLPHCRVLPRMRRRRSRRRRRPELRPCRPDLRRSVPRMRRNGTQHSFEVRGADKGLGGWGRADHWQPF
jgi:hypothetical protein